VAKKRIIPKLQLMESKILKDELVLVITEKYKKIKEIGDAVSQAKIYEAQSVDELILNYLSPSKNTNNNRELFIDKLKQISQEVFIPICVGGGICNLGDIGTLLKNGADKILINSAAFNNLNFIKESSSLFGSQCIVVAIDYKVIGDKIQIFCSSGTIIHDIDIHEWISKVIEFGAGEIILTNIDKDGSMSGLDIENIQKLSKNITVPIISSGGCGNAQHFIDGFNLSDSDAIAAGTFFCMQDQNTIQTRSQIKNSGIDIRTLN
tara:strand:- start:54 stop:845 length:792 start_codon:yes stop_codon:yes gene_type:complete